MGVIPVDLSCPSGREVALGLSGQAHSYRGAVVAVDGSLKTGGRMGVAIVSLNDSVAAHSVAVFDQGSSIRSEMLVPATVPTHMSLNRHSQPVQAPDGPPWQTRLSVLSRSCRRTAEKEQGRSVRWSRDVRRRHSLGVTEKR